MSDFNSKFELEGIVRKINSKQSLKNSTGDKRIVILDESNGKIVSKTRAFRRYRKYLVYCDTVLKGEVDGIEVEDFESLNSMFLKITYKVQCPYEDAEILIEKLFYGSGENPQKKLNIYIERFVEDYVEKFDSTAVFFRDFFKYRQNLIKELKKNIARDLGLRLDGNVTLKHEKDLKTINVEESFFEVFVANYDGGLQLKYKALLDIHPEPEYRINAILRFDNQKDLNKIIKNSIKKSLIKSVTLNEFIGDFERVKEQITTALNNRLKKEGRILTHLSIQTETLVSDTEKEYLLDDFPVSCKLKDSSIDVTHNLMLNIEDLGKYKNANITDLDRWVKDKLVSITKHVLFEKTYLDLILSYENTSRNVSDESITPQERIKEKMTEATKKIGISVKQLISIPKVKPLELLNGFSFDVGDTMEFSTVDTRIKVKLVISVTGRIDDLRKIEKHINPQIDIISKMKSKVLEGVKQVIDVVEPERYYIRFKYAEIELGDKYSVEKELIDTISKKLKKEFYASELTITPKPLDTDITIRFAKLKSKLYDFEFETFPFREGGGGEKVQFKVKYKIDGVNPKGWHQFQSKTFESIEEEIQQINMLLQDHLKDTLSTVRTEQLMYRTQMDSRTIEDIANLKLAPIIAETFGLVIKIVFIGREATRLEDKYHDRRQKVIDIHEKKIETEKKTSITVANMKVIELNSLIERYSQLQSIPEYANSEEALSIKKQIDEFPSEFDDMNIGDGFADIDDDEGNDLNDLLSFLSGNKEGLKEIGSASTGDEREIEIRDIEFEEEE